MPNASVKNRLEQLKTILSDSLTQANKLLADNQPNDTIELLQKASAEYRNTFQARIKGPYPLADFDAIQTLKEEVVKLDKEVQSLMTSIQINTFMTIDSTSNTESNPVIARYERALRQLNNLDTRKAPHIRPLIQELTQNVTHQKTSDIATLTDVLEGTHKRLSGTMSHEDYYALSLTMKNKASPKMKTLGGIMLTLGAAILAVSIAFGPLSLAAAGFFCMGYSATFFGKQSTPLSSAMKALNNSGTDALHYEAVPVKAP